jgi:L-threonylcarbamoyladenylate synthase
MPIMRDEIYNALEVLQKGGIILYPTDTVWGIGCDATNAEAVQKIYDLKQRVASKSMIVLLDNDNKLQRYVKEVPDVAWDLIDAADRPLTIIYPGAIYLAPNLIAEDGSIAIRITNDDFCKRLIGRLKKPLVSTSANISGNSTPSAFHQIDESILEGVDYVVNLPSQQDEKGQPSTIIKLAVNGEIEIIRK